MKTFRSNALWRLGSLLLVLLATASCKDFTDELQKLGGRVEALEQKVLEANKEYEALNEIVVAIQTNGYVTKVQKNDDGTTTIRFNTGKEFTLRNGRVGANGKDATLLVSVAQDTDGEWYWTLNGEWMLDGQGNKIRAGAKDGKDGANGADGKSADQVGAAVPKVRINSDGYWEIAADGVNYEPTGVKANGTDGRDGLDGNKGRDDIFDRIEVSADGKSITIHMRDGRSFTVPIILSD